MTLRHAQAPSLNRLVYVEPAVAEFARNPLSVTNRGRGLSGVGNSTFGLGP